jgi:hypothetical protein
MSAVTDRRVHAVLSDGSFIVRYDRAGKWFREWLPSELKPRRMLSMGTVVELSAKATTVNYGLPGGSTFDTLVRRARGDRQVV